MMFSRRICIIINRLRQKIKFLRTTLSLVLCEELPDCITSGMVYVSADKSHEWYMAMQCPCGCGEVIELSLLPHRRPRWSIHWGLLGTISVNPSIWRTKNCRSHFFLTNNKIYWCGTSKG